MKMNLKKMNKGLDFLREKYGADMEAMLGCYESIQSGEIAKVGK